MSKKVVFLGLAATAVATVCAVKHVAQYHHAEIKAKSRKNSVALNKNKTVNNTVSKTVKAPTGCRQTYPVVDLNALRGAYLRGWRG